MAKLLTAKEVRNDIISNIEFFKENIDKINFHVKVTLEILIIQFGSDSDDNSYISSLIKQANKYDVDVTVVQVPKDSDGDDFVTEINNYMSDPTSFVGVLFVGEATNNDAKDAIKSIPFILDLDSVGNEASNNRNYTNCQMALPCTVQSILAILEHYEIELEGANVVVLGRSERVGKPLAQALTCNNATVTLCHSKTKNLKEITKRADIIISAIGRAKMIDDSYVSENQIIIDAGINLDEFGNVCGDIDFDKVKPIVDMITPVPGGVGPLTTLCVIRTIYCNMFNLLLNELNTKTEVDYVEPEPAPEEEVSNVVAFPGSKYTS